jgi:hypothetical protein
MGEPGNCCRRKSSAFQTADSFSEVNFVFSRMGANFACLALQVGQRSPRSFAGLRDDERRRPVVGYSQTLAWVQGLNSAWPVKELTGSDSLHVANIRVRHPLNQAGKGALIILGPLAVKLSPGIRVDSWTFSSVHSCPCLQKRMSLTTVWMFGSSLAKGAGLCQASADDEAAAEAHKAVD